MKVLLVSCIKSLFSVRIMILKGNMILKKIVLAVLVAFIISFSILSVSLFLYHYKLENGNWVLKPTTSILNQKNFYSQVSNIDKKKIFLIGSSQVEPLNTNIIQEDLLKNNLNFSVYNLGVGGDVPKARVKTLDWIISAKPSIVVYGIGDRDFPAFDTPGLNNQINLLPNVHFTLQNWLFDEFGKFQDSLFFLDSPKLDFLTSIFGNSQSGGFRVFFSNPNIYAKYLDSTDWPVANDTTLKIQSQQSRLFDIFPLEKNIDYISFKKMLQQFHDNKITVIVYVTPQERYRLEKIPYPVQFTAALNGISQEYPDIPVYSLWDKYADMHIWKDYTHVINNSNKSSRIYSDDVAKMIIENTPLSANSQVDNETQHLPRFNYKLESHQEALQ